MKHLFLLLALLCAAVHAEPTGWVESTSIFTNPDNSKRPWIVFNGTTHPVGSCPGFDGTQAAFAPCNFAPDQWTDIPLAQYGVGPDAKSIFVEGILIITPVEIAGTPNLWFQCRAPGSTLPAGAYQAQTIGQVTAVMLPNGKPGWVWIGQRSTVAMFCPVADGKTQFYWHYDGAGYFGVSLSIQAWTR